MDLDLREYLEDYLIEFEDHLTQLNSGLLELEKLPDDSALIDLLFRVVHTIKGNAGTMGFSEINRLGHVMEDLMGEVRGKRLSITPPIIESLLKGYDAIAALRDCIVNNKPPPPNVEEIIATIRSCASLPAEGAQKTEPKGPPKVERPPAAAHAGTEAAVDVHYYILLEFLPEMVMKAVRAFLVLNKLKDIGTVSESIPSTREIEEDKPFDILLIKLSSKTPLSRIETILSFGEAKDVRLQPLSPEQARLPLSSIAAEIHGEEPSAAAGPASVTGPGIAPAGGAGTSAPTPTVAPQIPSPTRVGYETASQRSQPAPESATPRVDSSSTGQPPVGRTVQEYVDALTDDQKASIAEAHQNDLNVFGIEMQFRDRGEGCRIRAMALINQIADLGQVLTMCPTREGLFEGHFDGQLELSISSEREAGQIRRLLTCPDVAQLRVETLTLEGARIVSLEGRESKRGPAVVGPMPAIVQGKGEDNKRSPATQTVRVGVDRLDHLMNLVGELVITKTQLVQLLSHYHDAGNSEDFNTILAGLNQKLTMITTALQAGIMKVRMVQIGQVFFRFSRLVRDLSKALGKQVDFIMEGTETELDKTVIDEIGDPLMHLIRNALDHGIEPPAIRKSLGKSERGILLLRAQQAGDHIIVEVVDDGAGLDLDKIRQRALERNLVDPGVLKTMSPAEVYNFIFLPGFSTADKVSTVSGRGVGMDVVKSAIENLAGDVQMKSEPNTGTTFQIKLPLTLAIIQGLLVRVGHESFAIPLSTVKETVLLDESALHIINNHNAIMFREEIIPLIYLDRWFDLPGADSKKSFIVFAGDDDNKIGLVVNSLIGRREIVIKSLDKRYVDVKGFAGATILGDGTVSLILDVPALIEDARGLFIS